MNCPLAFTSRVQGDTWAQKRPGPKWAQAQELGLSPIRVRAQSVISDFPNLGRFDTWALGPAIFSNSGRGPLGMGPGLLLVMSGLWALCVSLGPLFGAWALIWRFIYKAPPVWRGYRIDTAICMCVGKGTDPKSKSCFYSEKHQKDADHMQ